MWNDRRHILEKVFKACAFGIGIFFDKFGFLLFKLYFPYYRNASYVPGIPGIAKGK